MIRNLLQSAVQRFVPLVTMSYAPPVKKDVDAVAEDEVVHRIRITLTSRNVANLEKVCDVLKKSALDQELHVSGPVRLPTKVRVLIEADVLLWLNLCI